jgi:hypothetical protein
LYVLSRFYSAISFTKYDGYGVDGPEW